ncbi:MAG: phosphatidylglycerol lysyltransferase domain-containing protein, partial [Pseudomonadota bacterium]
MIPEFPRFRSLELDDRHFIQEIFRMYQPETSEWTFTNLYIWRSHYGFQWSMYGDWFILLCIRKDQRYHAFQPIGPPSRKEVTVALLEWLRKEKGADSARIERADQRLVSELEGLPGILIEADREQFDYLYRCIDLIELAGRKYHGKRNHINKFLRTQPFTYEPFDEKHRQACLGLADRWCVLHRCEEDLNLTGEWDAVREILTHFQDLQVKGGVILMKNGVKAF